MAELKKYTSFKALKSGEKPDNVDRFDIHNLSEFEDFLKRLRAEYSNKKKTQTHNGKQLGR